MNKSEKRILYEAECKLKKGWTQGWSTRSKDGTPLDLSLLRQGFKPYSFGLLGAVGHTVMWNYSDEWEQAIDSLKKALARKIKKRVNFDRLVIWNDSPRRKKEEVIALVRRARAIANKKK